MRPFPVNGLVPWGRTDRIRILRRRQHPKHYWVYDMQGVSNVDHRMLHSIIMDRAAYAVGDQVEFPHKRMLQVLERRWSFKLGDVRYLLGPMGLHLIGPQWYEQRQVLEQRAVEEGEAVKRR